jgi:hypothetical protein
MIKRALLIGTMIAGMASCLAQSKPASTPTSTPTPTPPKTPIGIYLYQAGTKESDPVPKELGEINRLLPFQQPLPFVGYTVLADSLSSIENLLLNRQSGSPSGGTGITNLVSRVAVPQLLGLGVEYGNILQSTNGTTTTLRANFLGAGQFLLSRQVLPDCFELDQPNCPTQSRWLQRLSANAAFESRNDQVITGTAVSPGSTTPTPVDLFGSAFRMASWGIRLDINSHNPHDPKFLKAYLDVMAGLQKSTEAPALATAANQFFAGLTPLQCRDPAQEAHGVFSVLPDKRGKPECVYDEWVEQTIPKLQHAANWEQFKQTLQTQLDDLITRLTKAVPDFHDRTAKVSQAARAYFALRDNLVKSIQTHQFTLEYTNQHAINQPSTSNVRVIYSDQPGQAPILLTVNGAVTFYNSVPTGFTATNLRDVQVAGQMDRRLGTFANFKNAVFTLGAYYQWMKDDALINIGPGNVAPGSGIVLPGPAAQLLGTKGNIFVAQAKLTVPINNTFKVPISVTGANRKELINEQDIRGQVGITVDLDTLFGKAN